MINIGIIGLGKIARDQHLPSLEANGAYQLVGAVDPRGAPEEGIAKFKSQAEMIAALPDLEAVAVCTPPSVRYGIARECLEAGLHVLLEKPPGVTTGEVMELEALAQAKGVTLFTTWHAQYNPGVEAAKALLAGQRIAAMNIVWHEDVRKWHPGQEWIWAPGGFGVFDPGINAFSIATHILPGRLLVQKAALSYPANKQAPIAAEIDFTSPAANGRVHASLNWDHQGGEAWNIDITLADGRRMLLKDGGSRLEVDGSPRAGEGPGEYPGIYARFAELIAGRKSLVDLEPLRLVADAFLAAERVEVGAFE